MKIIWTSLASKSYYLIIDYLLEKWDLKVVENFINEVEKSMLLIKNNPEFFEKWEANSNYRRGYINELVSFYYRINGNEIVIHLFWGYYQSPRKLRKLLLNR